MGMVGIDIIGKCDQHPGARDVRPCPLEASDAFLIIESTVVIAGHNELDYMVFHSLFWQIFVGTIFIYLIECVVVYLCINISAKHVGNA